MAASVHVTAGPSGPGTTARGEEPRVAGLLGFAARDGRGSPGAVDVREGADQLPGISRRLDRVCRISLLLKALDAVLEIVGGILLLFIAPHSIHRAWHAGLSRTTSPAALTMVHLPARPRPRHPQCLRRIRRLAHLARIPCETRPPRRSGGQDRCCTDRTRALVRDRRFAVRTHG